MRRSQLRKPAGDVGQRYVGSEKDPTYNDKVGARKNIYGGEAASAFADYLITATCARRF